MIKDMTYPLHDDVNVGLLRLWVPQARSSRAQKYIFIHV